MFFGAGNRAKPKEKEACCASDARTCPFVRRPRGKEAYVKYLCRSGKVSFVPSPHPLSPFLLFPPPRVGTYPYAAVCARARARVISAVIHAAGFHDDERRRRTLEFATRGSRWRRAAPFAVPASFARVRETEKRRRTRHQAKALGRLLATSREEEEGEKREPRARAHACKVSRPSTGSVCFGVYFFFSCHLLPSPAVSSFLAQFFIRTPSRREKRIFVAYR